MSFAHRFDVRQWFRLERWNLGVIRRRPGDLEEIVVSGRLATVQWCEPQSWLRFKADPFIWRLAGQLRIIFEDYHYLSGRGEIRSMLLADAAECKATTLEINGATHFSYPQIIEHEGTTYCIPENSESGGVELYLWCVGESQWTRLARIIDAPVLDPTLLFHEGFWYLFGTLDSDMPIERTRLWVAPSLRGPWRPHAAQARTPDGDSGCRPAGPFFFSSGFWYRPVQDKTGGYGCAVKLYRIETLSPDTFAETFVSCVEPDEFGPYPHGLHTLTVSDACILIDG